MDATLLYSSLTVILATLLAANVSRVRGKHAVLFGDGGNAAMRAAVRAHGNLVEYAPLTLLMLLLVESSGAADRTLLHVAGGTFVTARLLHAAGILYGRGANPGRALGATLTLLVTLSLAVWGLLIALG